MSAIWKSPEAAASVRARYAAFLNLWPAPSEQRRVSTSQGDTFVISSGPKDAPPVVLLHGSASNSASWLGDAAALSARFRVHAVDVIGEPGFSAESRPPLASGAYAPWIGEVLDALGVPRAALVGLSLGGWLAADFATRHPERVIGLVLLCPGGIGRHRNILIWAAPLLLMGSWGQRRMMQKILGPGLARAEMTPEGQAFGAFNAQIFAGFRPRMEALPPITSDALARLVMPVMTVLGAQDAMIDSADTRRALTAAAPHTRVLWLPDDGHMLVGHGAAIADFLAETAV
jgi:pimeloyl-ACP methyl ester carboxylesterase